MNGNSNMLPRRRHILARLLFIHNTTLKHQTALPSSESESPKMRLESRVRVPQVRQVAYIGLTC